MIDEIKDEVLKPIRWCGQYLELIDQTKLPNEQVYNSYDTIEGVASAIQSMVVRGAPAIGISAAYGLVFAFNDLDDESFVDVARVDQVVQKACAHLLASRPTAVNLQTALERMLNLWQSLQSNLPANKVALRNAFVEEATAIHHDDLKFNYEMSSHGLKALQSVSAEPIGVLTHCNTGSLATGGLGTALGIIKVAYRKGFIRNVCITETRPWLQGSRLTAFELGVEDIPFELMVEGAVGYKMQQGAIDWLIVGADRIAANGDVANKIGTYALCVLAKAHGVKVMVAAPSTTLDFQLASGSEIPIELRDSTEILKAAGYDLQSQNAKNIQVYNPAFDIAPAELIDYIVTEKGFCPPSELERLKV